MIIRARVVDRAIATNIVVEQNEMRTLKSLKRVVQDAEDNGIDPATLMVDPEDVAELEEDTLGNPEDETGEIADDE